MRITRREKECVIENADKGAIIFHKDSPDYIYIITSKSGKKGMVRLNDGRFFDSWAKDGWIEVDGELII